MSKKRDINFNAPKQPAKPSSMEELIQSAETDWKAGNRQHAFIKVLGAIAMVSKGVCFAMDKADLALRNTQENCSHKFVDSTHCLKCGWEPPTVSPPK